MAGATTRVTRRLAAARQEGRTMILYYSPGACSIVTHIALEEAGFEFQARRVVLARGEHLSADYLEVNPRARVPALDTGRSIVTENVAILNFIAALGGADGSVPIADPYRAARCNELLGWFASTVHIAFAQLWRAERFTDDTSVHEAIQAGGREALRRHFAEIEGLSGDGWIVPGSFTAADSYLLAFFRWGRRIEEDMSQYPRWAALLGRVLERPAVKRVVSIEGLDEADFRLPVAAVGA